MFKARDTVTGVGEDVVKGDSFPYVSTNLSSGNAYGMPESVEVNSRAFEEEAILCCI